MNLGELVVQLGVKADTFTVRDFGNAIADIPFSVASAITSLGGLSLGFAEMTKNVLNMTTGFEVFTASTGLNARALEQWQMVAQRSFLDPSIVTSSVNSLTSLMSQLNLGHGLPLAAAQAFGMLGFSPNDYRLNGLDMLKKLQEGTRGMDPKQATALLSALIPNADQMMRVFQTPASEREKLQPIMSQNAINQTAEFQKELANFNNVVMRNFVDALVKVEPAMGNLANAMGGFVELMGGVGGIFSGMLNKFSRDVIRDEPVPTPNAPRWIRDTLDFIKNNVSNPDVTIHTNIYSNATDAEAVGRFAAEQIIIAQMRKTASDVNNRGR